MSEQSRDQWAKELLTSTLELAWCASEPQARMVADAAAVEVERLQAAKTKAEEAELAAAQELDEVKAERDALGRLVHKKAVALQRAEAKLAAIGRLCPTDYDDREQLLSALFKILIGRGEAEEVGNGH